jgi:hypothetical protein
MNSRIDEFMMEEEPHFKKGELTLLSITSIIFLSLVLAIFKTGNSVGFVNVSTVAVIPKMEVGVFEDYYTSGLVWVYSMVYRVYEKVTRFIF